MEANLKTHLLLEFYGLPGCGKSTISHQFADTLRMQGLNVCEPSYEIDRKYCKMMRKVVKLTKLALFAINDSCAYKAVRELVRANEYRGMSALQQLANIAHKIESYRLADKYDVSIWDEGLVQTSISLAVNGTRSALDNEASLISFTGDVKSMKVYARVDKETALTRMKNRATNDSRVEKMTMLEDKIKFLDRFEKACDSVAQREKNHIAGYIEIDTVLLSLEDINKMLLESLK